MKKTIITAVALLLVGGSLFAQDSKVEEVLNANRFGLFIGVGSSWLNPKSSTQEEYSLSNAGGRPAFAFGLNAERVLNERYAVYSGIGVEWEGGQVLANLSNGQTAPDTTYASRMDVTYKMQYIRVPLGLKLKAANIANLRIFGLIGADAGVLISKRTDIDRQFYDGVAGTFSATDSEVDTKNSATVPFNLGYQIGIGAEYDITDNNAVYFKVLYRNGLIDVTNPDGLIGTGNMDNYKFKDGNVASNMFGIRVGYFF